MEGIILILIAFIIIFIIAYRNNTGGSVYKYVVNQVGAVYERVAPYSFKEIREKVKSLGQEYSPRQYTIQILVFSASAAIVSYLYFYNILVCIVYVIAAISIIPYLTYLRVKRVYSEYIFEQVQVYTTNTIMEFATTQSFVKSLEGVYSSGVLEDPIKTDVKVMIDMAYENGSIEPSINYMNEKHNYYIIRNMHQLFLQITNEGSKDAGASLENMSLDIDMLVENVYRDRIDRASFYKKFMQFGVILYLMAMLIQFLLGIERYITMLDNLLIVVMLHGILIINTVFILSGTKYYNENVGGE